jgi:hypothetical protein
VKPDSIKASEGDDAYTCTSSLCELGWRRAAHWYTMVSHVRYALMIVEGIGCVKYIQRT